MQQFHSHISSSQNDASRVWMNLILFHQANSDKKSSSEEPNSLSTPSNYQVLFSNAVSFPFLKWDKTKKESGMESHCDPKNSLETCLFGVLSDLLDLKRSKWSKRNMIMSKESKTLKKNGTEINGAHSQLDDILWLKRAYAWICH